MSSETLTVEECQTLQARLLKCAPVGFEDTIKTGKVNEHILFAELQTMFSQVSWFERVQKLLIKCALQASQHPGLNVWDELIYFLAEPTQSQHLADKAKIRFSAHLAIMLMLLNRVSKDPKAFAAYNQLIERYIKEIVASDTTPHETKSKQIPLYVTLMIGQKAQTEVYCKLLLQVTDENVMKQYNQSNFTYFKESMCNLIFHSVP